MLHTYFKLICTVRTYIVNAVPITILIGLTFNISLMLQFEWYDPAYYRKEETESLSTSIKKYGHFVSIAETVGNALTFIILAKNT